jgi:hypothetical protein
MSRSGALGKLLRFGHNSECLAEGANLRPKMAHFERKSYVFGLLQGSKSLPFRVETIYDRISGKLALTALCCASIMGMSFFQQGAFTAKDVDEPDDRAQGGIR